MEIYTHAVDNFLNRIADEDPLEATRERRDEIEKKIKNAVVNPEQIYHGEPEKPPIHIRGKIAVVVGKKNDKDEYVPYEDFGDDDIVAPAVYHSSTFIDNDDEKQKKAQ